MLRKSVENFDWLDTIEPRTVQAVMKRVVEYITAVDSQVGALYEGRQQAEKVQIPADELTGTILK